MLCTSSKSEKKKKEAAVASPKKMLDEPVTSKADSDNKLPDADTDSANKTEQPEMESTEEIGQQDTDEVEQQDSANTNEVKADVTNKLEQDGETETSNEEQPDTESTNKPVKIECVMGDIEDDPLSEHVDRLAIAEVLSSANDEVDGERNDFEIGEDLLVQYLRKGDTKRLKQALRGGGWGPRHGMRKNLWRHMCRHLHKAVEHDEFAEVAEELFPADDTSDHEIRFPSFVDVENVNSYFLSTEGIIKVKKVLNAIEHYKPDIIHCPLLFSLVSLFMHFKSESDSYNSAYALLRSKESAFITQSNVAYEASKLVIRDLAKKHAGIIKVKKVLNAIEHYNPDIIHCPLLFSLVSLFMHFKSESDSYNSAYALLRSKESAFITQSNVAYEASKLVIRDLAKKHAKSGYVHLVRQSSNIDTVFDSWLWWIFQDLPFSHLLCVMDCYLHEGMKVLYRVALAIVILYGKLHAKKATQSPKHEKSSATVVQSLRQFCREIPVKPDKLLKTGFGVRGLTRKEIRKLQVKNEMYLHSRKHLLGNNGGGDVANGNKMAMSKSFSGPIILQNTGSNMLNLDLPSPDDRHRSQSVGRLHSQLKFNPAHSSILDKNSLFTIWTWLPTRYAVCQPMLLYTSEEHGTSLVTLYQMIENHQPTVIVIKSTNDEIFGAFCSAHWRDRRQRGPHLSYFGTGETFLFTLTPEKKKYAWVGLTDENIPNTANMFQAGDRHILTIGGGHGEAISLDESLLHCRTEKCDTFNNEPLCCTEDFTCKVVEVYGFQ